MGIDPGYDRLGIGIICRKNNKDVYVYSVCIQSDKKESFINRLLYINNQLEIIINKYSPDLIVIESLFFAKNVKTAMQVAEARGSLLLTSSKYTKYILELTPMQIKSSLTGDGHADKDKVAYMVYQLLNLNKVENWKNNKHIDDEIDALSIALAGSQYAK